MPVIQLLTQWRVSTCVTDKYLCHMPSRRKQRERDTAHGRVRTPSGCVIMAVVYPLIIERYLAKQNPLLQTDKPHQMFADAPPKAPAAGTHTHTH